MIFRIFRYYRISKKYDTVPALQKQTVQWMNCNPEGTVYRVRLVNHINKKWFQGKWFDIHPKYLKELTHGKTQKPVLDKVHNHSQQRRANNKTRKSIRGDGY